MDALFDAHYARLVRSLTVAAGDREVAADAVQDAFVQAHLKWRRIREYDDPVGWVRRVAIHRISNHHRRVARGRSAAARSGDGDWSDRDEVQAVVRLDVAAAVARLPLQQRLAVALFYLEGLSVEQTADEMGLVAGTVKTHLHRARESLRPLLEVL